MPNYETTKLYFNVTDEKFDSILDTYCTKNEESGKTVIDFQKIIPMPESVYIGPLGEKERQTYPGEKNWYDWRVKNWGTKWNACDGDFDENEHSIWFDSAWSFPKPIIQKLAELTKATIHAYTHNEDLGLGLGHAVYHITADGIIDSDWYQYDYGTECFWHFLKSEFGIDKSEIDDLEEE